MKLPGLLLAGMAMLFAGCNGDASAKPEVRLFAAMSLTDVVEDLAALYEKTTGVHVVPNTSSSSMLARQIDAGADADVFLSANPDWVDDLEERGHVRPERRTNLLSNRLVLIAPRGKPATVEMTKSFDIAGAFDGRLALGDPDHVPAGIYAKAALEHFGWATPLEKRLLPCANVRAALLMVERGETPLGIVYKTDAALSDEVAVVGTFPADAHPQILYVMAVCEGASDTAEPFARFLRSPEAAQVFERHGFTPIAAK
jgi:molybdate transport system substrate-binding protein